VSNVDPTGREAPGSKLQRFDLETHPYLAGATMKREPNGDWVCAEDALAEIARLHHTLELIAGLLERARFDIEKGWDAAAYDVFGQAMRLARGEEISNG
jgi:hypothetical protein